MLREIAGQIKARVSASELCAQVGLQLDRHGNALCPFHSDQKTPSLKVYRDPARGWRCFGCNTGGSVIDFAMRWYDITFRQAVVRLDADFGLGLPLTGKTTREERRRSHEDARKWAHERAREQLAVAEAEAAYWACFDRYMACVRAMDDHRPRRGQEIDVRWAACAMLLPEIRDEYERALDALTALRKGRWKQNAGTTAKAKA